MAEEQIGGEGRLYQGEDKILRWRIRDYTTNALVDVSGWTVVFDVRLRDNATTALITKTCTVSGSYNATESLNTQYVTAALADTDTKTMSAPKTYRYSLKRTDTGLEDVLRAGDFVLEKATQS